MKKKTITNILIGIVLIFAVINFILYVRSISNSWELYHLALEFRNDGIDISNTEIQSYLYRAISETFVLVSSTITALICIVIFFLINPLFTIDLKNEKRTPFKISISNIFLFIVLISAIIALCFLSKLLHELYTSPQLLVHIVDYPSQYYQVQNERVKRWESYCIVAIIFITVIILVSAFALFYTNFPNVINKFKQKKVENKQKRIEKLQLKLNNLKKDE